MPLATPLIKVSATRGYGAEVILHGANYDEACDEAIAPLPAQTPHLHPCLRRRCGHRRAGHHRPRDCSSRIPDLEAVVVPIGGGGLIGGIACAIKETNPKIQVIGVQTARLPSMLRARRSRKPVTLPAAATIADGIAVRRAGERTLPLVQKYVDDIVTVDEEEDRQRHPPAARAGEDARRRRRRRRHWPRWCSARAARTGKQSRRARLRRQHRRHAARRASSSAAWSKTAAWSACACTCRDHPGALHNSPAILAAQRANIVETCHNRAYYGVSLGETAIDITLETRGPEHIAELLAAVAAAGYPHERVL